MLAAEVLQKSETALRDIVAKAAAAGDYAGIMQVASWAKAVRDLLEKKPTARDAGADFTVANGGAATAAQVKNRRTPRKNSHNPDRRGSNAICHRYF